MSEQRNGVSAWEPLGAHVATLLDGVVRAIPSELRSDVCLVCVFVGFEEASVLPFGTVSWNTRAHLRRRAAEIGRRSALAEWSSTGFYAAEAAVIAAVETDPVGFELRRRAILDSGLSLDNLAAEEDPIDREAAIWDGFVDAVVAAVACTHAAGVLQMLARAVPIFIDVQEYEGDELVELNRRGNPPDVWPVLDRLSGRPLDEVGTWWQ